MTEEKKRGRRKGVKLDPLKVLYNTINKLNFPGVFKLNNENRTISWLAKHDKGIMHERFLEYALRILKINMDNDRFKVTYSASNEDIATFKIIEQHCDVINNS